MKAAPYFIEMEFIQQNALPVELMYLCAPGTSLGTGWARFSFAKPSLFSDPKAHINALLDIDKCLQNVFGDKVSEAPAADIQYSPDRWRLPVKSADNDSASFCANLSDRLREKRRDSQNYTLSTPSQTHSGASNLASRRSSRLICYGNQKRFSMSDDIQMGLSRFASSCHVDSSSAKLLFVYPEDDPHGILVTTNELARLEPGIYLNDTLVELDLRWIFEDISPSLQQRSFYFSSFFYRKLTAHNPRPSVGSSQSQDARFEFAHRQVRKWTRNVNIFERDFLFIPICEHLHWYLIIVAFPRAMLTGKKIASPSNVDGDASHAAEAEIQDIEEQEGRAISENLASSAVSSDVFDTEHFSGFISRNLEKDLSEKDAVDTTLHIAQVNSLSTQLPTSDVELGETDGTESSRGV